VQGRQLQVVVADDHPVIRSGLESAFRDDPVIRIVGTGTTFADLLASLEAAPPDVLVLDLRGMGEGPVTMVVQLQRSFPDLPIVVFSSFVELAPELVQQGVLGYVLKDELLTHLRTALLAAGQGQVYLSPGVQTYINRRNQISQAIQIRPRELTVLRLLDENLDTAEIAQEMQIDMRVVHNYITALRAKTGLRSRQKLIEWYRLTLKESQATKEI
jgi:DNA-binding NarL/FixJ family response regulator